MRIIAGTFRGRRLATVGKTDNAAHLRPTTDRVRENLRRYKKKDLSEVLNLSINETLSRTVMTSVTTLLALISLFVLGGDVIRGFVFAMIWGVMVGTYSSVFVASSTLLRLGVKRDWSKPSNTDGNQFANIDA